MASGGWWGLGRVGEAVRWPARPVMGGRVAAGRLPAPAGPGGAFVARWRGRRRGRGSRAGVAPGQRGLAVTSTGGGGGPLWPGRRRCRRGAATGGPRGRPSQQACLPLNQAFPPSPPPRHSSCRLFAHVKDNAATYGLTAEEVTAMEGSEAEAEAQAEAPPKAAEPVAETRCGRVQGQLGEGVCGRGVGGAASAGRGLRGFSTALGRASCPACGRRICVKPPAPLLQPSR